MSPLTDHQLTPPRGTPRLAEYCPACQVELPDGMGLFEHCQGVEHRDRAYRSHVSLVRNLMLLVREHEAALGLMPAEVEPGGEAGL